MVKVSEVKNTPDNFEEIDFVIDNLDTATTTRTLRNIKKSLIYSLKNEYKIKDKDNLNELSNFILDINGLNTENFDFVKNIETLIDKKLNDVSIDDNSNKNEKTIKGLMKEVETSVDKAIGYDLLYRVMKELFGKKEAKRLTGLMYDYSLGLSDSSNILSPYCWALDASKIPTIGREFGQLPSAPSKRLSSYISALSETVHQLSSHLAGAIAIGTFFLDIAHVMIYKDNDGKGYSLEDVYNNKIVRKYIENEMQQFVHSVNHLSRNGIECVTEDTEVLTPQGFKNYKNLNIGDDIYTWKDGKLNIQKVQRVNIKEYKGEMHQYRGRDVIQTVTPNHKVLYKKYNTYKFELKDSVEIFNNKTPIDIPISMENTKPDINLSDELIQLLAIVLTDGHLKESGGVSKIVQIVKSKNREGHDLIKNICNKLGYALKETTFESNFDHLHDKEYDKIEMVDYRLSVEDSKEIINLLNGERKIPQMLFNFSQRQAELFLRTWASFDGHIAEKEYDRIRIQCDNYDIANDIQHICFLAGFGSRITERQISNNVNSTIYVIPYKRKNKTASTKEIIQYEGIVWCPTTEDGIVVYRKEGKVFVSGNSPFTNISIFDKPKLRTLINDENLGWYFPKLKNMTKEEHTEYVLNYIIEIQKIYMNFFEKGNPLKSGEPYRFPVSTINISKKVEQGMITVEDREFLKSIINPEFFRYNIFTSEGTKVASCCRLISDSEMIDLAGQSNSFGGSSVSLGSHRVITTNFARIGIICENYEDYFNILEKRIEDSAKILKAHKQLITLLTKKGLQPFISNGWIQLSRMFSTFGILGIVEGSEILKTRFEDLKDKDVKAEILSFFNEKVLEYSKQYEITGNIEQIPAESYAIRLAKVDNKLFNSPYKIYSNQFIPLWDQESSVWERMDEDGKYNQLLTGGGIVHLNIGEKLTNKQIENLIEYSIQSGCEHFSLNPTYSKCENGHTNFGKLETCPICGEPIVDYITRVVGFFTNVESWKFEKVEYDFNKRNIYQNGDFNKQ